MAAKPPSPSPSPSPAGTSPSRQDHERQMTPVGQPLYLTGVLATGAIACALLLVRARGPLLLLLCLLLPLLVAWCSLAQRQRGGPSSALLLASTHLLFSALTLLMRSRLGAGLAERAALHSYEGVLYALVVLPLGPTLPLPRQAALRSALSALDCVFLMLVAKPRTQQHFWHSLHGCMSIVAMRFMLSSAVGLAADISRRRVFKQPVAAPADKVSAASEAVAAKGRHSARAAPVANACAGSARQAALSAEGLAAGVTLPMPTKVGSAGAGGDSLPGTLHVQRTNEAANEMTSSTESSEGMFDGLSWAPLRPQPRPPPLHTHFSALAKAHALPPAATPATPGTSCDGDTAYRSSIRRIRVTVKVPHAELEVLQLGSLSVSQLQARVREQCGPALTVNSMSVRKGCVIVELEAVCLAAAAAAASVTAQPSTTTSSQPSVAAAPTNSQLLRSASLVSSMPDWLHLLRLQDYGLVGGGSASSASAAGEDVVSVRLDSQSALFRYNSTASCWTQLNQPEAAPRPHRSPRAAPAAAAAAMLGGAATGTRSRVSLASGGLLLRPACLVLGGAAVVRIKARLPPGIAEAGNKTYEAVSAGRALPCVVLSALPSPAGRDGGEEAVLEVDLSVASPGLLRFNLWSMPAAAPPGATDTATPQPSRLLATQALLLLPSGGGDGSASAEAEAASSELARVADDCDPKTLEDVFADLGSLLELSGDGGAASHPVAEVEPSASAGPDAAGIGGQARVSARQSPEYLAQLQSAAGSLAEWATAAACPASRRLIVGQVRLLDGMLAAARSEAAASASSAAPATAAVAAAFVSEPAAAAAAAAAPRPQPRSMLTTLRALPSTLLALRPLDRAELAIYGTPPRMWCVVVLLKCIVGCSRTVTTRLAAGETNVGAMVVEMMALILWGLPYLAILLSSLVSDAVARTRAQRAAASGAAPDRAPAAAAAATEAAAQPPSALSRAVAFATRHSRLLLHVYRSLILLCMGLNVLAVPFIFKVASAGLDVPAKILYMVMETYDYRAAILVIFMIDLPSFYVLYTSVHGPGAIMHVVSLALMAVTLHVGMEAWRLSMRVQQQRLVTGQEGSGKEKAAAAAAGSAAASGAKAGKLE